MGENEKRWENTAALWLMAVLVLCVSAVAVAATVRLIAWVLP